MSFPSINRALDSIIQDVLPHIEDEPSQLSSRVDELLQSTLAAAAQAGSVEVGASALNAPGSPEARKRQSRAYKIIQERAQELKLSKQQSLQAAVLKRLGKLSHQRLEALHESQDPEPSPLPRALQQLNQRLSHEGLSLDQILLAAVEIKLTGTQPEHLATHVQMIRDSARQLTELAELGYEAPGLSEAIEIASKPAVSAAAQEDLAYIVETYSSLLEPAARKRKRRLSHELTQERSLLDDLMKTGLAEQSRPYLEAMDALSSADWLSPYRDYDQLYSEISNALTPPGEVTEMHFRKLLACAPPMQTLLANSSAEKLVSLLENDVQHVALYDMLVLGDKMVALERLVQEQQLELRDFKLEDLSRLAQLCIQLQPLRQQLSQAPETVAAPRFEALQVSPSEAAHYEEQAQEQLAGGNASDAEYSYWMAAQGYFQAGKLGAVKEVQQARCAAAQFGSDHPLVLALTAKKLSQAKAAGVSVSGLGGGALKGHALTVTYCELDGKPTWRFALKLLGHAKLSVDAWTAALLKADSSQLSCMLPAQLDAEKTELSVTGRHHYPAADGDSLSSKGSYAMPDSKQLVLAVDQVGSIHVGLCPEMKALHNMIFVQVAGELALDKALPVCQQLLTAVGCPPVLHPSRPEDQQRRILLEVFRAFHPVTAFHFERNPECYRIAPGVLREQLETLKPDMAEVFREHIDERGKPRFQSEPIAGKTVNQIQLAERLKEHGAVGLFLGMGGSVQMNVATVIKILDQGLLSSQRRFLSGILRVGESSYTDHKEGGASGVFARLVTQRLCREKAIKDFAFHGSLQILISLEALNAADCYGSDSDRYGTRVGPIWENRPNLMQLVDALERPPAKRIAPPSLERKYGTANEVIVPDAISPGHILKIMVRSEADRALLSTGLNKAGHGRVPIVVADKFSEELWT